MASEDNKFLVSPDIFDDNDYCPHGVGFDEECEECAEEDEVDEPDAVEEYEYQCSACGANETLSNYRSSYVCPWCGEGVMHREEN